MKVVLVAINSQYTHTALAARALRAAALANSVTASCQIELWEGTINEDWRRNTAALFAQQADLYAFSAYIWNAEHIARVAERLHQILPQALLICGGPEVSYDSLEQLRAMPWLDGILRGEAEETFPALLKALTLQGDCTPSSDENIVHEHAMFKRDSAHTLLATLSLPGWVPQPDCQGQNQGCDVSFPIVRDLATLPFPYSDAEMAATPHRIYYYESTRGCPFDCQYCLSAAQLPVRFRPLPLVYQDLDRFIAAGVRQVKFVDRTFNWAPHHCHAIWRYLIDAAAQGAVTSFHFELAAELIDDATLRLMREAPPGLFQFEIGVQSTHMATLDAVHRPNNLTLIQQRVRQLQALRRQHLHLDLIAGLPHEGWAETTASFNWVASLRPEMQQSGFLKMLRGSGLRAGADARGDLYSPHPPYEILQTPWLSHMDLLELERIAALVERYGNSGRFRLILHGLERCLGSALTLYAQMATFWEEQGYTLSAREAVHYQRLAEFASVCGMRRDEALCRLACDFCLYHRDEDLPSPLDEAIASFSPQEARALRTEALREDSSIGRAVRQRFPSLQGLDDRALWRKIRVERFVLNPDTLIDIEPQVSVPNVLQMFVLQADNYGNRKGVRLAVALDSSLL